MKSAAPSDKDSSVSVLLGLLSCQEPLELQYSQTLQLWLPAVLVPDALAEFAPHSALGPLPECIPLEV
jgi:hypothetical protein